MEGKPEMDEHIKGLIEEAYQKILGTANRILRNCKLFSIEILQQEDPSYEVIAQQLEEAAELIEIVVESMAEDAEAFRTAIKAKEYAVEISAIAGAIKLGDNDLLTELIEQLDRRPFT